MPQTGRELWRTRTIPGPGERGNETWGDIPFGERKHVGAWMPPSYDPELKLLYIGTSVTSPAPKFLLGGNDKKYLYHNCTLALDAQTGKIVWYYQHVVDHWDLDHTFERILLDTAVAPAKESVAWINPTHQARREAQGPHRHSRQDRHRLHAGSAHRTVSVGHADHPSERRRRRSTAAPARSR